MLTLIILYMDSGLAILHMSEEIHSGLKVKKKSQDTTGLKNQYLGHERSFDHKILIQNKSVFSEHKGGAHDGRCPRQEVNL